jgi:hypothetical protein
MHSRLSLTLRGALLGLVALSASLPGVVPAQAQSAPIVEDFTRDTVGRAPASFSTPVGFWSIGTIDGVKPMLFEDGTQWKSPSGGMLADQAKALYGDRWAEFIDDLSETAYYPTAVYNGVENFTSGKITMRFMIIGGDVDQDVAILFGYQPNGDYYALRSDTQENNMLLYQWIQGQPNSLKRTPNVPTSFAQWHDQTLLVQGTQMAGYLDGQKFMDYTLSAPLSGRVGVWTKTDTVALIDSFIVEPAAQ